MSSNDDITRRDFVTMTVAGLAVAAGLTPPRSRASPKRRSRSRRPTAPATRRSFIPRPARTRPSSSGPMRSACVRRCATWRSGWPAESGYSVLVPNPYYRIGKAPMWEDASKVDFATERPKLNPMMASINAAGTVEKDAPALIAWLDQQPQVDRTKKVGTQGYCMGGALVMRTAAAVPDRVGAGASFHGGGLATANPNSPHLLAPKIKARMYIAIAINDDKQQPDAKTTLKTTFDAAKVPVEVEVYDMAQHGWCVPDMPNNLYSKADAERAWAKLLALYKAGLG